MAILGTLLRNRRAGEAGLAWNMAAPAGPETVGLRSADFAAGGGMAREQAGKRAGGRNVSPELSWSGVPEAVARLLLVVEDSEQQPRRPVPRSCTASP